MGASIVGSRRRLIGRSLRDADFWSTFMRVLAVVVLAATMSVAQSEMVRTQPSSSGVYETLVSERSKAIVNIKFILKAEGQEQEGEIPGVMIERDGLVLASTIGLGEFQSRFAGTSITPTAIRILIGEDTQGVEATMLARDSELALAWFRIDKPAEGGYDAVNFADGSAQQVGSGLLVVSQLGKFFHRAIVVNEGSVACVTSKPRRVLIPSISLVATDFGVPVFDTQGRPVGIFSAVLPDKDELMGTPGGLEEMMKGVPGLKMIIPADEIVAATRKAKESHQQVPKDKPATEEKPHGSP
jgi:S1-C subfamily serine protease